MARPKKDGVYINYYIQKDKLDKYCKKKLDKLIQWLLNEYWSNFWMSMTRKHTKKKHKINGLDLSSNPYLIYR